MSPIKGLSEQRRIPRVGKIHLGIKVLSRNKIEIPRATDYFVVPPEVAKVYGDKPTELPIMIPVEDEEYWASQYYRCYSRSRGLVCKGDGETCRRMVDTTTDEMANRDSKEITWKTELPCEGRDCVFYQRKQCREVMNLQFMLPEVPGLGVWQIDTSSINSIRNINSSAELIRGICGRIRMLPLLLTLEKQEVVNPDDGKKKTVCVLNLRHGRSLQVLLADSLKPVHELLAPVPEDAKEAPLDVVETQEPSDLEQAEENIEELWPVAPPNAKGASQAAVATKQPAEPPETKGFINMDWLRECLRTFQNKKLTAWSEDNLLSYLKITYKIETKTVFEGVEKLSKSQAIHFENKIQETLDMIQGGQ